MKRIVLLLLGFLMSMLSVKAQRENVVDRNIFTIDKNIPSYLYLNMDNSFNKSALSDGKIGIKLQQLLNLNESTTAVFVKSVKDIAGGTHLSFAEHYNGVEVEGTRCTIHFDSEGKMTMVNGNFRTIERLNTKPSITESNALKSAFNHLNVGRIDYASQKEKTLLKKLVVLVKDDVAHLAYKFAIDWDALDLHYFVFVDAHSGQVIDKQKAYCNVSATVNTKYSGSQIIETQLYSGQYRLRDYSRGNGIETYDSSGNDYTSTDNSWNMNYYNIAALDAHWGAEEVYDYYLYTFGLNSYDDNGGKIESRVNNEGYYNASWNYLSNSIKIGFYSSSIHTPLVCLDIIAHEITHGVTFNHSNLSTSGESAALNEGLSDVFAVCIENQVKPNNGIKIWKIGEDAVSFRDLRNPDCKYYQGSGWSTYGEEHTNSGVFGYWFYLLAEGGTGTNQSGTYLPVTGIGLDDAISICYLMNTSYLSSNSTYSDAKLCSYAAAQALGYSDDVINQLKRAWYDVGVETLDGLGLAIIGPNVINSSYAYYIDNLPEGFSVTWSLSNSYYNQNCLQQNAPSSNQCTITRSTSQDMNNATLTALIKKNGVTVKTLTFNKVYAYAGVQGSYYNGQTTKQINLPYPLYVYPNRSIWINTPNLLNSTVSFSGDATPSSVVLNSSNGQLNMNVPSTGTIVVNIQSIGNNSYLPVIISSNPPMLTISQSEDMIEVRMNNCRYIEDQEHSNANSPTAKKSSKMLVEIFDSSTGERKYSTSILKDNLSINTSQWKAGVYIVRANVGGETFEKKITIR